MDVSDPEHLCYISRTVKRLTIIFYGIHRIHGAIYNFITIRRQDDEEESTSMIIVSLLFAACSSLNLYVGCINMYQQRGLLRNLPKSV